ncbi:MAG TPA: hypothetical protein VM686_24350, partial [Polyangiaceae bacterium]|nr:hypothetical protein [Polyangiaceae bacterium]
MVKGSRDAKVWRRGWFEFRLALVPVLGCLLAPACYSARNLDTSGGQGGAGGGGGTAAAGCPLSVPSNGSSCDCPSCACSYDAGDCFCSSGSWSCDPMFECASGERIPLPSACDAVQHCVDGSDELGCTCEASQFDCGDECIPQSWVCDSTSDCVDGSDEIDCPC